jgi:hypothetical protein
MANLNGFDARQVEPAADFEPLPAGKYVAAITASEVKDTKSGSGSYLELTFQVVEGPHKGRNLWARLNLDNPNEIAVKIARAELSALCRAINVLEPKDSVELHNLPLLVTVKLKAREDTGELTNVISGYAKRETATAPKPAPAAGGTAPWRR